MHAQVSFQGPYSWLAGELPSVFDADCADEAGLYLWTIRTDSAGELIYYVGETGRRFRSRMLEHLKEQLAGWYRLYDPVRMRAGEKRLLWRGMYGRGRPKTPESFVERLPELVGPLQEYLRTMRFHLAPVELEARARKRIEAALAEHLRRQPEPVGSFQDADITYRPRTQDETPMRVTLSSAVALEGLPATLEA